MTKKMLNSEEKITFILAVSFLFFFSTVSGAQAQPHGPLNFKGAWQVNLLDVCATLNLGNVGTCIGVVTPGPDGTVSSTGIVSVLESPVRSAGRVTADFFRQFECQSPFGEDCIILLAVHFKSVNLVEDTPGEAQWVAHARIVDTSPPIPTILCDISEMEFLNVVGQVDRNEAVHDICSIPNGVNYVLVGFIEVIASIDANVHGHQSFARLEWDISVLPIGGTIISLNSFTTTAGDGQVLIEWTTGAEIDNEGFNILRSEAEEGPYTKLNDTLIPAKAIQPGGATYELVDTTVENGKTYFYKVEDVDTSGKKTEHGPLEIAVIEGNTASLDLSTETESGTVVGDTSNESSSGFGCGFIKTEGNIRPPSNGEMAGTLLVLSLPFIWVLIRRAWRCRRNLRIHPDTLPLGTQ